MERIATNILCLVFVIVAGCGNGNQHNRYGYETVAKDLRRDTERARRENQRALALMTDHKDVKAEEALKTALSADTMYGPAHNNLGKIYFLQRKFYLAAWEYQYAIKLMPNQPEPKNNLGMVYESVGKLDSAVSCFDEAKKLEPNNAQVVGNLARSRIRRGDRGPEVRELLEQLVEMDTRPEWTAWAREQLAVLSPTTQSSVLSTATTPTTLP
jgi:Flp pilus assembly protein TadD